MAVLPKSYGDTWDISRKTKIQGIREIGVRKGAVVEEELKHRC